MLRTLILGFLLLLAARGAAADETAVPSTPTVAQVPPSTATSGKTAR